MLIAEVGGEIPKRICFEPIHGVAEPLEIW